MRVWFGLTVAIGVAQIASKRSAISRRHEQRPGVCLAALDN